MAPKSSRLLQIHLRANVAPGVAPLALRQWAAQALDALKAPRGEVTIVIATPAESRRLNRQYRQKDRPTNVLTFPYETPESLGDIILCPTVIRREAKQQGSVYRDYVRFLLQHGCIHLLGLDHHTNAEVKAWDHLEHRLHELH